MDFTLNEVAKIKCHICLEEAGPELFTTVISQDKMKKYQQEAHNANYIFCEICYCENFKKESFPLQCSHRFCTACFIEWVTHMINNARVGVDELCCPLDKQPIEIEYIQHLLDPVTVAKYY